MGGDDVAVFQRKGIEGSPEFVMAHDERRGETDSCPGRVACGARRDILELDGIHQRQGLDVMVGLFGSGWRDGLVHDNGIESSPEDPAHIGDERLERVHETYSKWE